MARLLGEAYIAILPETSQFGPQARAQLDKDMAQLHPEAHVGAQLNKADVAKIGTQLKAITKANPVNVGVSLDKRAAAAMVAQLDAFIKGHTADVGVRLSAAQLAKMQGTLDAFLKGNNADVGVQLNPAQLAKIKTTLDAFLAEQKGTLDYNILPALAKIQMVKSADASLQAFIQEGNARALDLNILPALAKIAAVKAAEGGLSGNKGGSLNIGSDTAALSNTSSLLARVGAALMDLTKVEDSNTDAVNRNAGGYGIWGRAINVLQQKIPLFGGALTALHFPDVIAQASGWHILAEAVIETIAVWGPATVALAVFAAASEQDARQIVGQWKTVQTVMKATGQPIAGLQVGLSKLSLAIRPEIWTAFGEGLIAIEGNSNKLVGPLQSIGHLFDVLGSHIDQLVKSGGGGFAKFVQGGANDMHELGEAFGNVGKIVAVFFQSVPGYATILLHLGTDFLGAAAAVLAFLQPVLKVGLAVHGAIFYLGLASTAILAFGRGALGATATVLNTGKAAENSGGKIQGLGVALGNSAGLLVNWGKGALSYTKGISGIATESGLAAAGSKVLGDAVGLIPFAPEVALALGLAAAVGVGLFFAFRKTADAASILGTKLVALVQGSNPANLFINTQHAIEGAGTALETQIGQWNATYKAMGYVDTELNYSTKVVKVHRQALYDAGPDFSNYIANFAKVTAVAKPAAENQLAVAKAAGGMSNAINIAAAIGIKWNSVNTASVSQLKTIIGEIQGYTKAVDFMGNAEGQASANVAALNIVASAQYTNVQKVNSAWSSLLTLIGGGENAFISLQQGLGTLNTDLKAAGASMTGLNPASLTLRADFQSVAQAAESQISALTSIVAVSSGATAAQRNLAEKGIKAVVSELIPYAGANKVAQAEVVQLAQRANNSLTTWQAVVKWVGKQGAAGAANTLQNANFLLASSIKNVTAVANGLTGAMNGLVAAAQDKLLLALNGGIAKMGAFGKALALNRGQLTAQTQQLGVSYYDALVKSGLGSQQAAGYVLSLAKSLGVNNAGLEKLTADMAAAQAAQAKTSAQTKALTGDVKANAISFEGFASKLNLSKAAAQSLWQVLAQQDVAMVAGKATTAKAAFIDFAENGLKLTSAQANQLWNTNKAQNLTALAGKADTTKGSFINLAKQGLNLTTQQAQQLWNTLRLQYLDTLVAKGDNAKAHFISLAKDGLDLTTNQANNLWNTLRNQYLDTLASKAGETRQAFILTARQFGLTASAASGLWGQLRGLAGGSPYAVAVEETLSGSGSISAKISAASIILGGGGGVITPKAASPSNPSVKAKEETTIPKAASGAWITGNHSNTDSVHIMAKPGELIVPAEHAPSVAQHLAAGGHKVPGYSSGGFVANAGAVGNNAVQGAKTIENDAIAFTKLAMGQFAGDLNNALQAQQSAANGAPGGPFGGGPASLLTIAKYLMANGFNRGAAAGIAATIDGESGGNPESRNCVPLTYKVVTNRGVLAHDEVQVGDTTPVYSVRQGRIVDAIVVDVPYHNMAKICRIGNASWSVVCTHDHKWITEDDELVRADDMVPGTTKLVVGPDRYEAVDFFEDLGRDNTFCLTTSTGTWTTVTDDGDTLWTGNSGGWGLIGWTGNVVGLPAGYSGPTGNVQFDLGKQLQGVVGYANARGGKGPLNAAGNISPVQAGDVWSSYEAPAVRDSDTRPSVANALYAELGSSTAVAAKAVQTQKQVTGKVNQVKPFSAGGMVSEPVYGFGANSGIPYSFAENGPEMVSPGSDTPTNPNMPSSTALGQQQTNKLLQQVIQLLAQQPYAMAKVQQNGLGAGMRRGAFSTGG